MMEVSVLLTITVLVLAHLIIGMCGSFYFEYLSKSFNKDCSFSAVGSPTSGL